MICHSEGIPRLQEAILDAAVHATDPHTKEKVIGMMVRYVYVYVYALLESHSAVLNLIFNS